MAGESKKKHVVFDVVGTCVSYSAFYEAIERQLGERFKEHGIKVQLFGFAWLEATEREYTYLSLSGRYTTLWAVHRALFYRILHQAGIDEPRQFATDADVDAIMASFDRLEMRAGIHETFQKLRDAGFKVWGLTAESKQRVGGYFKAAGFELPDANLLSCDDGAVAKPHPEAYKPILEKLGEGEKWFAAAHMWDVSGARAVGFKAAYASVWEKEPCAEIFGEMDVMAETLPEMADKIIASSS